MKVCLLILVPLFLLMSCAEQQVEAEPLPEGWSGVQVAGSDLIVAVPQGWQTVDLAAAEESAEAQAASTEGDVKDIFETLASDISEGRTRLQLAGRTDEDTAVTVVVSVEEGDDDLAAAGVRRIKRLNDLLGWAGLQVARPTEVTPALGDGLVVQATSNPGGLATQTVEVIVVRDGTTYSFLGTAPADDTVFPALLANIVVSTTLA